MDKIMKSVLIVIISTVIGAFLAPMGMEIPLMAIFAVIGVIASVIYLVYSSHPKRGMPYGGFQLLLQQFIKYFNWFFKAKTSSRPII